MSYSERHIGFIDFLGFSSRVIASGVDGADSREVTKIAKLLQTHTNVSFHHKERHHRPTAVDFRKSTFSDHVVISTKASPQGLSAIAANLSEISIYCAQEGVYCRGSIATGKLYHPNDNIMFGPAFLSAHDLEQDEAIYPRIVLSREIEDILIDFFKNDKRRREKIEINDMFPRDPDGRRVLNTFLPLRNSQREIYDLTFPKMDRDVALDAIAANLNEQISQAQKSRDSKILAKLKYLRNRIKNRWAPEVFNSKD